jgi:hypothetical protein
MERADHAADAAVPDRPSGEAAQCQLHFLYQDLFHGAKHTGNAEYRTLQMLSELEAGLAQAGAGGAGQRLLRHRR